MSVSCQQETSPTLLVRMLPKIRRDLAGCRIFIELITGPFLKEGGTPDQFRTSLARAITLGWLWRHESG
jgi:hypothetical protein